MVRIGPLQFGLARAPKAGTKSPRLDEMGATGSQIFGGILSQADYNNIFSGPTSYDEYDKMRNDGQVRSALTAVKLPLMNADWYIERASDKPQDREIAERMHDALMHKMTVSWRTVLWHILLHLDYGVMPLEEVWELRDGLVMPRKLAPRMPKTILRWRVDEKGGLAGIEQQASTPRGFQTVVIPIEKLVVFVNELEGSNWKGRSLLRSAYKHWFYKDNLYRVQAIALEKRSLGVDVGKLMGDKISEEGKKEAEAALMTLHAHEKQFLVEVEGQFEYRLETGQRGGGLADPLPAIEHHDLRIVRSVLAEFLAMGSGSTGSLAMHKDKSAFLMMALGGIANTITDTLDAHFLRRWVDYNWTVDEYPVVRYSRLEVRDLVTYADAVEKLGKAGALTMDESVEKESRSLLDVPQLPAGTPRPTPVPAAGTETTARQVEKLLAVGRDVFERGDMRTVADVSVPFKRELAAELEPGVATPAEAIARATMIGARMKAAFVGEMIEQMGRGQYRSESLRSALITASRGGY